MIVDHQHQLMSGVFITFSGNCKKALTFYQTCFGGFLQFETFEQELEGYAEQPVVTGSLVSDRIIIHGSDLVHNEGRKLGNYLSIFLSCENIADRNAMINKLTVGKKSTQADYHDNQRLVEVTDAFEVRWVLGV